MSQSAEKNPELKETEPIEFEIFDLKPVVKHIVFVPKSAVAGLTTPFQGEAIISHGENFDPLEEMPVFTVEEDTFSVLEENLVASEKEIFSDSIKNQIELTDEMNALKWDYFNLIRTLIQDRVTIPEKLSNVAFTEVVKVEFTINKEGNITKEGVIIKKSSQYGELNGMAIFAIEEASLLFPPLPNRYPKEELTLVLPLQFVSRPDKKN